MTAQERKDAIDYIMAQLKDGYIDFGAHDENEIKIVIEAMSLLKTIEKTKEKLTTVIIPYEGISKD